MIELIIRPLGGAGGAVPFACRRQHRSLAWRSQRPTIGSRATMAKHTVAKPCGLTTSHLTYFEHAVAAGRSVPAVPVPATLHRTCRGTCDALSAGRLRGAPAWSAISASNLIKRLALPAAVRTAVIAADHNEAGQHPAWEAARRWRAESRPVHVATPDNPSTDLSACGIAASVGVQHGLN